MLARTAALLTAVVLAGACGPAPAPTPTGTAAVSAKPPTEPTPVPVSPSGNEQVASSFDAFKPVSGTQLPIVDPGGPGMVSCGLVGPVHLADLTAGPAGAETLEGQRYDVLRATIKRYGDDDEFAGLKDATFREFSVDAGTVEFVGDRGDPDGPFSTVSVALEGDTWRRTGMDGSCGVSGEPGPGWDPVSWSLDPAYPAPGGDALTLHLLASAARCTPNGSLEGQFAPAYAFVEPRIVRIQLFARTEGLVTSCAGLPPTPVTLDLPEPVRLRELFDANPAP